MKSFNFNPNPVINTQNLGYSNEIKSVRIINMLGQTLSEKLINTRTVQIEMSNLPIGTYLVEVKSQDSSKTIKALKKKLSISKKKSPAKTAGLFHFKIILLIF
jgi:hypothetical protein